MILITSLVMAGSFLYARPVAAQEKLGVWGDPLSGEMIGFEAFKVIGLGNRDPRLIIASIVQIGLGFLGTLAVLLILYGGWLWMTAAGDDSKIDRAKDLIKNAVIGLLIILSSFAIATFVLRALIASTGAFNANYSASSGVNDGGSLSALGAGVIGSVYPAPNQKEVPRNTSIIISFKEAMDATTICDKVVAGKCSAEAKILPESIKIFPTKDAGAVVTEVAVASNDNKTFVLSPKAYLGTATEKNWYTVGLTTAIVKANKSKAFSISGFAWQFEVSNILDLTPPKVVSGGIFPAIDDEQDQPGQLLAARAAQASLLLNGSFKTARPWRVSYNKVNPGSPDLAIINPKSNSCDGQIEVAINYAKPLSASIAYRNLPGLVDSPETAIINRRIKTACGFELGLVNESDNFETGQAWTIDLSTEQVADSLIVGANVYNFVDKLTAARQIVVGASKEATAANIVAALANNADVSASLDLANKAKINLQAKQAGKIGNNLDLLTTAVADAMTIVPFGAGLDQVVNVKVLGKADKPRNAIIQINFDEAINPLTVSGRSEVLAKSIAVLAGETAVAGEFRISNQYKTVEFVPDAECGMNACGEKIYCLPGASQLRVELYAASLATVCASNDDCVAKSPFATCEQSVCYDSAAGAFYPTGQLGTGIVDGASNSLDGNRDAKAIGPREIYSENTSSGLGDSFAWSFWTSDVLDVTAPNIISILPNYNQADVNVSEPVEIKFSKLMMADSVRTGTVMISKGEKKIEHALINLRSLAKSPLGYWLESANENAAAEANGELNSTKVNIFHSQLAALNKYRTQVGSGLKDSYQNCYKPCAGPSCGADSSSPSCCNGQAVDLSPALMCPDK